MPLQRLVGAPYSPRQRHETQQKETQALTCVSFVSIVYLFLVVVLNTSNRIKEGILV